MRPQPTWRHGCRLALSRVCCPLAQDSPVQGAATDSVRTARQTGEAVYCVRVTRSPGHSHCLTPISLLRQTRKINLRKPQNSNFGF